MYEGGIRQEKDTIIRPRKDVPECLDNRGRRRTGSILIVKSVHTTRTASRRRIRNKESISFPAAGVKGEINEWLLSLVPAGVAIMAGLRRGRIFLGSYVSDVSPEAYSTKVAPEACSVRAPRSYAILLST